MTSKTAAELQDSVQAIYDKVIELLTKESKEHDYLAAELYMAVTTVRDRLREVMGPELTKKIEKAFMVLPSMGSPSGRDIPPA